MFYPIFFLHHHHRHPRVLVALVHVPCSGKKVRCQLQRHLSLSILSTRRKRSIFFCWRVMCPVIDRYISSPRQRHRNPMNKKPLHKTSGAKRIGSGLGNRTGSSPGNRLGSIPGNRLGPSTGGINGKDPTGDGGGNKNQDGGLYRR